MQGSSFPGNRNVTPASLTSQAPHTPDRHAGAGRARCLSPALRRSFGDWSPEPPIQMTSSLVDALFWVAVALCAVAQLALLHSFFFGASRPARDAAASFRVTETLWAVVPAAVLVALLAATWDRMHEPQPFRFHLEPASASASNASAANASVPASGTVLPVGGGAS